MKNSYSFKSLNHKFSPLLRTFALIISFTFLTFPLPSSAADENNPTGKLCFTVSGTDDALSYNEAEKLIKDAYHYADLINSETGASSKPLETIEMTIEERRVIYIKQDETKLPGGSLKEFKNLVSECLTQEYTDDLFSRNWSLLSAPQFYESSSSIYWCTAGCVQFYPFILDGTDNFIYDFHTNNKEASCKVKIRIGAEKEDTGVISCSFKNVDGKWKVAESDFAKAITQVKYLHNAINPSTGDINIIVYFICLPITLTLCCVVIKKRYTDHFGFDLHCN